MASINPYIHFDGNAEEAFYFYKSVFGGEFVMVMRFKDMPPNPDFPFSAEDGDRIMHIALPIGQDDILMASDIHPAIGPLNIKENRSKISISAASREEADHLYNGLSEGGEVEVPLADSVWDSYFGMFRDKYGIEWMIDYDPKYQGKG
ncbi:VOC family protein [Leeuwenhoekiella polynyae]|uniref:PhnB protein n=1 Tax=Leeuwenhoekiella polynyae TaxID=1550906 RepID=A0A4Q0NXT5_9FLAO|nr:VOC family protein [Leeuwenhoekiella polynyae]RXG17093.1 PhnB protein [Leeuwenhoekiella polynyae]